jgi:hypothetical protein
MSEQPTPTLTPAERLRLVVERYRDALLRREQAIAHRIVARTQNPPTAETRGLVRSRKIQDPEVRRIRNTWLRVGRSL